jgi:outer membrane lipoprotein SlyB
VNERFRVLAATVLGAVAGGVFGWLYMTEQGRRVRDQIDPKLDDFIRELGRVRGTVQKARTAANEGWRSLNEITGGAQSPGRWSA